MNDVREYRRVAVFGGIYNSALALEATLEDACKHDIEAIFCLGDMGGFGPHPDHVFPLLQAGRVLTIQGNYDESLALGKSDCGCGYTDPRDNYFARVSYEYTFRHTSPERKVWLGTLPKQRRIPPRPTAAVDVPWVATDHQRVLVGILDPQRPGGKIPT